MNNNFRIRHHVDSARKTYYYNNKKCWITDIRKLFPLRPQASAFDHVPSLLTLVVGSSLRNGLPVTRHLFPQGPLRLISCSLKFLFSYYSGAVLINSL